MKKEGNKNKRIKETGKKKKEGRQKQRKNESCPTQ